MPNKVNQPAVEEYELRIIFHSVEERAKFKNWVRTKMPAVMGRPKFRKLRRENINGNALSKALSAIAKKGGIMSAHKRWGTILPPGMTMPEK